jgi:phosphoribosylformylglycinamidine synthase
MRFLSQFVHLKIESTRSVFTRGVSVGTVVTCPIAHGEGNYFADDVTLKNLEDGDQIVFRYCDAHGGVDSNSRISNPNGSCASIAGVCNSQGNVLGLMPHPERASESLIGWIGTDSGRQLLEGVLR